MAQESPSSKTAPKEKFFKFLPIWMWIIILIEIAVPVLFALATLNDPQTVSPGAEAINEPLALYIVRNFAVALGLALAVSFKSYAATLTLVIVRMCMDIPDIINSLFVFGVEGDMKKMMPVFIFLLVVLPIFAVVHLIKHYRAERSALNAARFDVL